MTKLSMSCSCNTSTTLSLIPNIPPPALPPISPHQLAPILLKTSIQHRPRAVAVFAAKSGGFPLNSVYIRFFLRKFYGALEYIVFFNRLDLDFVF